MGPRDLESGDDEDDDEEMLQLSGDTLSALEDFYAEKDVQQKLFESLKAEASQAQVEATTIPAVSRRLTMEMFAEDWNASQFWYTDETAKKIAEELLDSAGFSGSSSSSGALGPSLAIAVISTPSIYIQLHNLVLDMDESERPVLKLFEFDERFGVTNNFVRFDFNKPLALPQEFKGKFNQVIVDPPFFSDECQTKMAMTTRWLLDPGAVANGSARVVVCTGETMKDLIRGLHPGCKATDFKLEHTKARLSNEYTCYANFECGAWKWIT